MVLKATQDVIAGGPEDFLEANHLVIAGSHQEIGEHLADIARTRLGTQKVTWTDPSSTRAQRRFMERNWPQHYDRMIGAAKSYVAEFDDDTLDFSFLAYDAGVPGCSVVFYPPETTSIGHGILSRNYDFTIGNAAGLHGMTDLVNKSGADVSATDKLRPMSGRPFLIETHPDSGFSTLFMSGNDLLGGAADGINSEGLAVALLMDSETLYGPSYDPTVMNTVGLGEGNVPLFLLETCSTADEAEIALLGTLQRYVSNPCHYIICDREGNSFVWEYSPKRNKAHIVRRGAKPQCVTNHLLHAHEDQPSELIGESIDRLETLEEACSREEGDFSLEDIRANNASVAASLGIGEGQYANDIFPTRTLWYAQYDLKACSLEIDFYLGEDDTGIRRSQPRQFTLERG